VEHAAPFEAVRPWRTAAIVASGIATLELLVLIIAGTILLGRPLVSHGATAAAKPKATQTTAAKEKPKPEPQQTALLPRTRTSVLVLNGNGRSGAAHAEASQVSAHGYPISAVGNAATANNGPSLVMYRPGREREAKRLARDLGIGVVGPLDGLPLNSLHGAKLALVLGY
jgi:LytR cell envelope-related transcriptional attenuator